MTPFSVWANDRRLAALAEDARPALVLTQDGLRVDWANAAGARLLGARLGDIAAGGLVLSAGTLSGQIANLSSMLAQNGAIRLERLRFSGVGRLEALACACRWIGTPDGAKAVLVTALDVPRWLRVVSTRLAPAVDVLTGDLDPVVTPSALRDARELNPVASGTSLPLPDPGATWRWATSESEVSENGTVAAAEAEQAGLAPHELDAPGEPDLPAEGDTPLTPDEGAEAVMAAEAEQATAAADVRPDPEVPGHAAAPVEDMPEPEPMAPADADPMPEPALPVEEVLPDPVLAGPVLADANVPVVETIAADVGVEAVPVVEAVPEVAPAPVRSLIRRFVFQSDAEGRFTRVSPELSEALGAGAGDWVGRSAHDLMTDGFDREGRLARALASRDTFTGLQLDWPNSEALAITPIDISALPVFDRTRTFQGFRGFGVCRPPRPMTDEEALADMSAAMDAQAALIDSAAAAVQPDAPAPLAGPVGTVVNEDATGLIAPGVDAMPVETLMEAVIETAVPETTPAGDDAALALDIAAAALFGSETVAETAETAEATGSDEVAAPLPEAQAPVTAEPPSDEPAIPAFDAVIVDPPEMVAFDPVALAETAAFAESEGLEPVVLPNADNDPVPPVAELPEVSPAAAEEAASDGARPPVPAEPSTPEEEAPIFPISPTVIAFADIRNGRGESDPKVVRLRGTRPTTIERVTLSTSERNAFREIARVLGARIEGDTDFPDPPAVLAPLADLPAPVAAAEVPAMAAEPVASMAMASEEAALREMGSPVSTALLDRLPVGVIVARGEDLLFANRTLLDLLGYESIDVIGRIGGLARIFAGTGQATLSAGTGHAVLLATADGETVAVDGRMQTAPWNGENALLVTVRRPVDEEAGLRVRSAEEALSAAERRAAELQAVLDTATDGVVIIDGNGSVIGVNRSAEALFGHEAEDVAGQSMLMLFAPESHRAALDYLDGLKRNGVASVLNDGREVTGRVRQGGRVPLFMTIGRLGDGDRFCAVLRDITQFKKAEEELLASKRQAEDASSQKSDFLAKVSHEIRTPLNAIIGFAEVMIEERFGPVGNDRYRSYLKDIHGAGGHVIGLVNDLLDLAKIEAGKLDLTFASVALNDVIEQSVAIMQPQANRDRILIRTALSRSLPNVVADGRTVRQIVLNLLSNSIKFTPQGGQVIVSTTLSEIGEAVMRVRDTGVGMTDKELAVAMEPFRQVGTANRGGGTGLGLPLTKALVEANRASFMIQSTKNTGTLVEVIFPPTRVLAE